MPVARFLLKNIKLPKDAKILDLGAGTGLSSIPFIKKGYKNIILLDYSKGMLAKAIKRKELKKCRFIRQDIMKFDLKEKFDLIISIFSFASNSYFDEKDMQILWRKLAKHLKSNGIFALLGHDYEPKKTLFNKIKVVKGRLLKGIMLNGLLDKRNNNLFFLSKLSSIADAFDFWRFYYNFYWLGVKKLLF